jgi:hypothetical protein
MYVLIHMALQGQRSPLMDRSLAITGEIDHLRQGEILFQIRRNNHFICYPFMSSFSSSKSVIGRRSVHEHVSYFSVYHKGTDQQAQPSPSKVAPGVRGNRSIQLGPFICEDPPYYTQDQPIIPPAYQKCKKINEGDAGVIVAV